MTIIKIAFFIIFTFALALLYLPSLIILFPWHAFTGPLFLQFYSKCSLVIFRVKIDQYDKIDLSDKSKGYILISNHESFLDIFLLSALYKTVFLSKIEILYYPVLGQIGWIMGIVFVNRNSHNHRHKIVNEIAGKAQGRILTVFPQGTTCTIDDPLPFKRGLFKTVEINNNIEIIPITISYKDYMDIAWGAEGMMDNLKKVCAKKQIHVKITAHKHITINDYHDKSVAEITTMAEERVLSPLRKGY
ncbi:MAG: lysophospholipid acyltransferase family protein [Spirochaetota bacterium]